MCARNWPCEDDWARCPICDFATGVKNISDNAIMDTHQEACEAKFEAYLQKQSETNVTKSQVSKQRFARVIAEGGFSETEVAMFENLEALFGSVR